MTMPIHHFGKNRGTSVIGFAKIGFNTTADAAFFYTENVGIGGLYSFNIHGISEDNLAEAYVKSNENYQWATAKSEQFKEHLAMGGFFFRIPVNDYMSFNVKLLAGFFYIYKPAVQVEIGLPFTSTTIYETNANKMNFAFYNHVGGRFKVTNELFVVADLAYTGSKFDLDYYRNSQKVSETRHVGILMGSLGVAYEF